MGLVDISSAAAVLASGGIVGMPTETVYGLAADACDAKAVARVFACKERPAFDPLIIHVAPGMAVAAYAKVSDEANALMQAFWPGPLTLVLPRQAVIPDLVTSGLDTVGVRCPDHPIASALIQRVGRPLAAPSANKFGRLSPTLAEAVLQQLGDDLPVIDGGPCRVGVESTVLRLDPEPRILRPGGISAEAIAAVIGRAVLTDQQNADVAALSPAAPGMLASHYAPSVPVITHEHGETWTVEDDEACVFFEANRQAVKQARVLSSAGDLEEAAARLFAVLRELDALAVRAIHAELVPEQGIGIAINDRLRRAATPASSG